MAKLNDYDFGHDDRYRPRIDLDKCRASVENKDNTFSFCLRPRPCPLHDKGYALAEDNKAYPVERKQPKSVLQDWVTRLPLMQQSVLLAAIRGPDGMRKKHPAKSLIRWYRRSILLSAFEGAPINDPYAPGGGSFTGPVESGSLLRAANDFMDARDEMTLHYYCHFMHAVQIVGYNHPVFQVKDFWAIFYERMVAALHLNYEERDAMNKRLSDNEANWRERNDPSSTCSD